MQDSRLFGEEVNTLTDGDGNPATGPEPTVVVVGNVQQMAITKEVSVVDGGPALPGATLEYVVTARNVGALPALYVRIEDDILVTRNGSRVLSKDIPRTRAEVEAWVQGAKR